MRLKGLISKNKKILQIILNFLFPQQCVICEKLINSNKTQYLCSRCMLLLNLHPHVARKGIFLKECWAISHHEGVIKRLIHLFKYQNKPYLSTLFGEILSNYLKENNLLSFDLVMPVPLYKRRKEQRGYNQSELLADEVSKRTNIPVEKKTLKRVKNTISQFQLNSEQRKENMKDAFKVVNKESVFGKRVLLIDDISTTGITLEECARVLKKAKAKIVYALVISHG